MRDKSQKCSFRNLFHASCVSNNNREPIGSFPLYEWGRLVYPYGEKQAEAPTINRRVIPKMSNLPSVTDANFQAEVLDSPTPVMVDFWAPWCGPCRMLGPTLEQVQASREDVRIVKINIDENPQIAAQYRVQSIPMMIVFKNGQNAGSLMGNQPKSKIDSFLNGI